MCVINGFGTIKTLLKGLKTAHLEEHFLETSVLVLMKSGTESHGKPFLFVKIYFYLCSYFGVGSSEMQFLTEQFWSAPIFWNGFFEGAIISISWFMAAD